MARQHYFGGNERMSRIALLCLALTALAACNETPKSSGNPAADTGLFLARSGRAKDSLIRVKDSVIAERSRQLSEQSQLIGDAATSARLAAEIDKDLSGVRGLRTRGDTARVESAVSNASAQLTSAEKKVKLLIARLNSSEARVRKMRSDSATQAAFDSTQMAQLREYEASIADLRGTVQRQQQEIASLTQRVDSMVKVNVALAAHNDTITSRVNAMAAHEDSVFVAIGTEHDLISKGIVRKEGGNKLLFGMGRTLVPARTLDPTAFQVMSLSHDVTIPLPKADKEYRMVSRQSLQYTDLASAKAPVARGELKITNPGAFWAPSKYLILVQK
jgi:flagellar biosynthesis chaperone FliJ